MSGMRQKIQYSLALEPAHQGETPVGGCQGTEPVVAKLAPQSPALAPTSCRCPSLTPSNRRVRDPYARWCGRGGTARCPPIPIYDPNRSFTSRALRDPKPDAPPWNTAAWAVPWRRRRGRRDHKSPPLTATKIPMSQAEGRGWMGSLVSSDNREAHNVSPTGDPDMFPSWPTAVSRQGATRLSWVSSASRHSSSHRSRRAADECVPRSLCL